MVDTTWLLDVDGPINATDPGWSAPPWNRKLLYQHEDPGGKTELREFKLRWSPHLITRIRKLIATGTVDVVWCTTWCPQAHQLEDLWGFPSLGRAWTTHLHGFHAVQAKRAAARAVLTAGRRLIWTDDDAFPDRGPFIDELAALGGDLLLIKPDDRRGLRPADMATIEAFAATSPDVATIA